MQTDPVMCLQLFPSEEATHLRRAFALTFPERQVHPELGLLLHLVSPYLHHLWEGLPYFKALSLPFKLFWAPASSHLSLSRVLALGPAILHPDLYYISPPPSFSPKYSWPCHSHRKARLWRSPSALTPSTLLHPKRSVWATAFCSLRFPELSFESIESTSRSPLKKMSSLILKQNG